MRSNADTISMEEASEKLTYANRSPQSPMVIEHLHDVTNGTCHILPADITTPVLMDCSDSFVNTSVQEPTLLDTKCDDLVASSTPGKVEIPMINIPIMDSPGVKVRNPEVGLYSAEREKTTAIYSEDALCAENRNLFVTADTVPISEAGVFSLACEKDPLELQTAVTLSDPHQHSDVDSVSGLDSFTEFMKGGQVLKTSECTGKLELVAAGMNGSMAEVKVMPPLSTDLLMLSNSYEAESKVEVVAINGTNNSKMNSTVSLVATRKSSRCLSKSVYRRPVNLAVVFDSHASAPGNIQPANKREPSTADNSFNSSKGSEMNCQRQRLAPKQNKRISLSPERSSASDIKTVARRRSVPSVSSRGRTAKRAVAGVLEVLSSQSVDVTTAAEVTRDHVGECMSDILSSIDIMSDCQIKAEAGNSLENEVSTTAKDPGDLQQSISKGTTGNADMLNSSTQCGLFAVSCKHGVITDKLDLQNTTKDCSARSKDLLAEGIKIKSELGTSFSMQPEAPVSVIKGVKSGDGKDDQLEALSYSDKLHNFIRSDIDHIITAVISKCSEEANKFSLPRVDGVEKIDKNADLSSCSEADSAKASDERASPRKWKLGDMLWGKVSGHPWWPCIVALDPAKTVYTRIYGRNVQQYHVQFYGSERHHGWISEVASMPYEGGEAFKQMCNSPTLQTQQLKRGQQHLRPFEMPKHRVEAWHYAVSRADEALPKSPADRLAEFLTRYQLFTGEKTAGTPNDSSQKPKYKRKRSDSSGDQESPPVRKRLKAPDVVENSGSTTVASHDDRNTTDRDRLSTDRTTPAGVKRSARIATSHIICARELLGKVCRQYKSKLSRVPSIGPRRSKDTCAAGMVENGDSTKASRDDPENISNQLTINFTAGDETPTSTGKSAAKKVGKITTDSGDSLVDGTAAIMQSCNNSEQSEELENMESPTYFNVRNSAEKYLDNRMKSSTPLRPAINSVDSGSPKKVKLNNVHADAADKFSPVSVDDVVKKRPYRKRVVRNLEETSAGNEASATTVLQSTLPRKSSRSDRIPVARLRKSYGPGQRDDSGATAAEISCKSRRVKISEAIETGDADKRRPPIDSQERNDRSPVIRGRGRPRKTDLFTSVTSVARRGRRVVVTKRREAPMARRGLRIMLTTRRPPVDRKRKRVVKTTRVVPSDYTSDPEEKRGLSLSETIDEVVAELVRRYAGQPESVRDSTCTGKSRLLKSADSVDDELATEHSQVDKSVAVRKEKSAEQCQQGAEEQTTLESDVSKTEPVCRLCEKPGDAVVQCGGSCAGFFHAQCLGLSEKPDGVFSCQECITGVHTCFTCKQTDSNLVLCSIRSCGRYYHSECITRVKAVYHRRMPNGDERIICSLHTCSTCTSEKGTKRAKPKLCKGPLYQCVRCPVAYHCYSTCVAAGTVSVAGRYVLCAAHIQKSQKPPTIEPVNVPWCITCNKEKCDQRSVNVDDSKVKHTGCTNANNTLIKCSSCPAAFHKSCLKNCLHGGTTADNWKCGQCAVGHRRVYGEIVWAKIGNYRWWPAEICSMKSLLSPSNQALPHQDYHEFVVRMCGIDQNYWIHSSRVVPYQQSDHLRHDDISKRLKQSFQNAVSEATTLWHKWTTEREKQKELTVRVRKYRSNKPSPYKHVKCLVPIPGVEIGRVSLDEISRCHCDPNMDSPCGPASECLNRVLMCECHPLVCPAGDRCCNQNFVCRKDPPMEPFFTGNRGWGVRTKVDIVKGQFITEYVGDLIDQAEANRRLAAAHRRNITNFYMMTLDDCRIIDAGPKGNFSRFMNNSCQPNCETQKWLVNGDVRIGLFAKQNIAAGTELTFNYHMDCFGGEKFECKCNTANCSGFLGLRPKANGTRPPTAVANATAAVSTDTDTRVKQTKGQVNKPRRRSKKPKSVDRNSSASVCFSCSSATVPDHFIVCSEPLCSKTYHLDCVKLNGGKPDGKWICPRHRCTECGSVSFRQCLACPRSYCMQHAVGNVFDLSSGLHACSRHKDPPHGLIEGPLSSLPAVGEGQKTALETQSKRNVSVADKDSSQGASNSSGTRKYRRKQSVSHDDVTCKKKHLVESRKVAAAK